MLIGYREARRPYLVDDEARRRARLRIASNTVAKVHDWSVSVAVQAPGDGVDGTGGGRVGVAGGGASQGPMAAVADDTEFAGLGGAAGPPDRCRKTLPRRTDWRPPGTRLLSVGAHSLPGRFSGWPGL